MDHARARDTARRQGRMRAARPGPAIVAAALLASAVVACSTAAGPATNAPPRPDGSARTAWTFDGDAAGAAPPGATVFSGSWAVRAEADAPSRPNALCQTATAEFPAIALSLDQRDNVSIAAKVKPIRGSEDQAAGLIFRVRDQSNYYVVRANALEANVNIFAYVNGRRSQIAEGRAEVKAGVWQDLRAEAVGDQIRAFFGGRLVAEVRDKTFGSGGVGLWTKSDSVTCFDDVVATTLAAP